MGECRRCSSIARRRQAGFKRIRRKGGGRGLLMAEEAGHCDAVVGSLVVASLVGSDVAAVVGGNVGDG